jgi:hypothetical protein
MRFTIGLLRSNYQSRLERCPDGIDKTYGQVAADSPEVCFEEVCC